MNQRESKFFEHPSFYFNTESSAFKVAYLLINLTQNQNSKRGDIIYSSKNTPELLQFNYIDEKQLKQIDQLLVPSMVQAHDEMLEIFVLTSRPALFRESRYLICQTQEPGIIAYIDLFIDISFQFNNNTLPCYVFIKQIKEGIGLDEIKGVIYMNQNLIIEGITQTALQMLKLEQNVLYKQDGKTIFPEISPILDEFQQELQLYFINNPVEDETEHRLQPLKKNQFKSIRSLWMDIDYQVDMEVIMSYSKVNQIVYRSYLLLIKNAYRMMTDISQDSPLQRNSMTEIQNSSNIIFKMNPYQEWPILTVQKDDQTKRSQFNNSEHEDKPLNQQQEFLNSEFKPKSDSERPEQESKEQKNYMNSISSGSSKQSEIQRILLKSHFYSTFSQMKQQPRLLQLILIVNIISFVFIIGTASFYVTYYTQWQSNTRDNIKILQAFTMTSYTRGSLQGTAILIYTVLQLGPEQLNKQFKDKLEFDDMTFRQLVQIQHYNIEVFSNQMDEYSENSIIRQVFSNVQLKQVDVLTSDVNSVVGWTALFQLIYMIQNLKILSENDYYQFTKSLVYLLQSYKQYKDAYNILQTQLNGELQNILNQQDEVATNVRTLTICFLFFILILSFSVNYSYFQLVKKYLRCCEQISHVAVNEEQEYLQDLLKIQQSFDLYEQNFSIKDKFHVEQGQSNSGGKRNGSTYKFIHNSDQSNNNQNNKKFIKIQSNVNYRRKFYFLLENLSYIAFFIFYIFQSLQDQELIGNLRNKITLYQKCIQLTESVSETCMTNYVMQCQDLLIEFNIINKTEAQELSIYSNDSYYSANSLLSSMLDQNSYLSNEVKQLSTGNICKTLPAQQDECTAIDDGLLTQGILNPLSILFSFIRENIQTYTQIQRADEIFQLDDLIVENFIIDAIFAFVNHVRISIENDLVQQNNSDLVQWILFYIIIIGLNITQIYKTHKYKYDKIYKIRQQVYLLPPKSLYLEDSYFKTLTFMLKIENQLIHI
ncbi:hypothetical protein pb186bvf_006719 [Paramecium bursaria]